GESDGLLYFTMPLIDGETLQQRLDRERQLPLTDALGLAKQVAAALGYAHARGCIHRDLKPSNVLLMGESALVSDFGAATALDGSDGGRLTQSGLCVGTPSYMSPEQWAPEERLDARSDLYALGCVLFEMLAGSPPFEGDTPVAVLNRQALEPAPMLRCKRPS